MGKLVRKHRPQYIYFLSPDWRLLIGIAYLTQGTQRLGACRVTPFSKVYKLHELNCVERFQRLINAIAVSHSFIRY